MKLSNIIRNLKRWYYDTPDRALDMAYRAALTIRAIEDEYFDGNKVSRETGDHSQQVLSYCESEVNKQITNAKLRLAEFKSTQSWLNNLAQPRSPFYGSDMSERSAIIIEKLNFIDEVLARYQPPPPEDRRSVSLVKVPEGNANSVTRPPQDEKGMTKGQSWGSNAGNNGNKANLEIASGKTGAVPRSILNTFSRIKREIDPQSRESEGEMINKFRQARNRTSISIKFLLLLIIIPLFTHQLTKTLIFKPIIQENFFNPNSEIIFLNQNLQEEAFMELENYERTLEFSSLLGMSPELSPEEKEEKVEEKAKELAHEYREEGANAISNVFADLASVVVFTWILLISREEITILKNFLDELVYGLSDSAKAFLIILFTDMFVGFHSPHGWEVILEGVSRHFGLPESRDFNFLFIATFPVILDTVLKYWIFRYLNRISPSAVATYKTMNE
ncbi:proton extrusion protein PcxA [Spirulina sp. CS-785/01]|uniref:proton extrusion protein PcxA n=1 Tax=Spirulina sp. CS-785/01 TaxID=3021716 RepID=UPI00232BCC0C|nr:proton extrusion protein PcxA [Spirulina sp. CS-785/01]MDB9314711.1 proton extrusion protein PcxA [Spirulina sp. CS-785/01]